MSCALLFWLIFAAGFVTSGVAIVFFRRSGETLLKPSWLAYQGLNQTGVRIAIAGNAGMAIGLIGIIVAAATSTN